MSGVAIIIKGADFSGMGLGTVTTKEAGKILIKRRIQEITTAGGALLYGNEENTITAVLEHQAKLGEMPKLDFIGYTGTKELPTKVFSLDKTFDLTLGEGGDTIFDDVVISTPPYCMQSRGGHMGGVVIKKLLRKLKKVYYKNTETLYTSHADPYNILFANILASSQINMAFIDSNKGHMNIQITPGQVKSFGDVYASNRGVDLFVSIAQDTEMADEKYNIVKVELDGKDVTAQSGPGDNYWQGGYEGKVSFGVNKGKMLIYGC